MYRSTQRVEIWSIYYSYFGKGCVLHLLQDNAFQVSTHVSETREMEPVRAAGDSKAAHVACWVVGVRIVCPWWRELEAFDLSCG